MNFTPAYREGGGPITAHEYYIPTATAVVKGQAVGFTPGTGIVVYNSTDADDAILGVAAEAHDGSTAGRQSGTTLLVYDEPDIIFKCIPKTLSTTTSGDATSWIDSTLTAANDIFNGGKIVIVSTNSIAGFSVGDVLDITDFANSGGDYTVTGAGGTIAAGMTGYIYPGKLAVLSHAFDTVATTYDNLDMDTAGGETFVIKDVTWDNAKKEATIFFKIRLHHLGNDGLTIS
jgi:hypothetical protein